MLNSISSRLRLRRILKYLWNINFNIMTENERQPAPDTWRSLHITREEIERAIVSIEEKMEGVDAIVEEELKAALCSRFRFQSPSMAKLETDPKTAAEMKTLRQRLVVSYLERFGNRIRALRSLVSEQVQN
jgi:hypothetical protein